MATANIVMDSAAIMGMSNVFYRFRHLSSNEKYATMPARLRMQIIGRHGGDPVDFELWCLAVSAINAWILETHVTTARSPWLDSLVTWGSVLTTFMVARRVMENWLYWIVVDGLAAYLYYTRGLSATAGLFVVYVLMVIYGYVVWRKQASMNPIANTETGRKASSV